MNKILSFGLALCLPLLVSATADSLFVARLAALPYVDSVAVLEDTVFPGGKYLLYVEQPVDWDCPDGDSFHQRVFLGHVSPDSLTVVVTEGYDASYASRLRYRDELSRLLNANNVVIEHRYFNTSTPEGCNWDYLTTRNAAADHHRVVSSLKQLYGRKWIATGISKGGQTCNMYRMYYPGDVDVTVPYVAPLCRSLEDGRHEPFIRYYCGTPAERKKIEDFQTEFLRRRERLRPAFDSLCVADGLQFWLGQDAIYDYCALEFSFAFWQWGTPTDGIPGKNAPDSTVFKYMMDVAGPDYLVKNSVHLSFHVQAAKELGYYGYDVQPFRKYLSIHSSKEYLPQIFLPHVQPDGSLTDGSSTLGVPCLAEPSEAALPDSVCEPSVAGGCFRFDSTMYLKMTDFLGTTDARMLFIYGQYDPWSAVAVEDYWSASVSGKGAKVVARTNADALKGIGTVRGLSAPERNADGTLRLPDDNILIYIQPRGSHRSRIGTFPEDTREEIMAVLHRWLFE